MAFLEIGHLHAGYGKLAVLRGVQLQAAEGKITAVLGANGAGKTTTLRSIMGVTSIHAGAIKINGQDVTGWPSRRIIRDAGTMMVPEGRQLFPELTVMENLAMGTYATRLTSATMKARVDELATAFPVIARKLHHKANSLSGGEQQMVAIGRAMVSHPRLLLADEVSQGISPILTLQLWEVLKQMAARGTTVLLVEQNVAAALRVAHRAVILKDGSVVMEGTAAEIAANEDIALAYLS